MPALLHPTLVVGVGPFGRSVTARLAEDVAALPEAERSRFVALELPTPSEFQKSGQTGDPLEKLKKDATERLRAVLRAGTGSAQPQLDIALVADTNEADGNTLAAIANTISEVLAQSFAVLFPPSLPPHQRTVWMNALLATPALADTPQGKAAIQTASTLEQWHFANPPSPCLSRVWLAPRQTASGVLSEEDVTRSVYLFASSAYLCGQRQSDAIRTRLEPPREPTRLLATFSVAAADVPVGRVLDYCTWRTALSGFDLLAKSAENQNVDPAAVEAAVGPLQASTWLSALEEGDAAQALRRRALAAAPRPIVKARPTPPNLVESGDAALARYADVLAADHAHDAAGPEIPGETDPALKAADVAEANAVQDALAAVDKLVDERLSPHDALQSLALLHRGLGLVADQLEKAGNKAIPDPVPAPAAEKERHDQTAGDALAAAREAATAKPSLLTALPAALGIGASTAIALAGLLAVTTVRSAAAPVAGAGPTLKGVGGAGLQGASLASVLGPGLILGLVVAAGWLVASLAIGTKKLKAALGEAEKAAADRASSSGTASAKASRAAEASLAARRKRAALAISRGVREKQVRLQAVRTAIQTAKKRAKDELARMGVRAGAVPADDATGELFPPETPLHWPLYPASSLPLLAQRSRSVRDETVWAQRLLEAGWPASGPWTDLPFCDEAAWMKAARAQHEALIENGPFSWPDVGALLSERVADFLREVPQALAFGVRPMREDGSRGVLMGEGELLALAPGDARPAVEQAQRSGTVATMNFLWSHGATPRLVVLTTATEFDAASAWRGLGR